ncbi:hypothetical protein WM40_24230 [Robbsia andropogonis]|uniref:Uncharacterized protein n=1 Tax=Robbsia andropogonis TaxID=28092 RepID=A0A0F5JTT2_9BURK|nr:hypothetical protein WM40_24230 [Robbsia andropogonis]
MFIFVSLIDVDLGCEGNIAQNDAEGIIHVSPFGWRNTHARIPNGCGLNRYVLNEHAVRHRDCEVNR